jgi:hypothetical protein
MVASSPCQNSPRVVAPIEEEEEGSTYSPLRQEKFWMRFWSLEGGRGGHAVAQLVEALLYK